ncbi:MAG: serine/threonine protein kinase [Myxococcaceae bacterium]|nr:serine/threonine protein kinase [Myxococcaceae bacterium]
MHRPNTGSLPADSDVTEVVLPSMVGNSSDDFDDTLPQGTVLGDYVVDRVIGRGGGGVVYAAHLLSSPQPAEGSERRSVRDKGVAIKVLRAEMACYPSMITRFLREAEAVHRIRHPNIIEIHQISEIEPHRPYYVMELLEGTDLRKMLQVHGRFAPKEVLALMEPICGAVQAAHSQGIIHRDIKANNVVVVEGVSASGEPTRVVKLLDFGIAKMLHADNNGQQGLTEPGAMLGTAHNMAPEQIRCERLDTRVDIYALGVLTYQLLTGQYPFHADDPRQVALLHLQAPAPRPSALAPVSPAVDAVVLRCLEKKPDKRYATADELIAALRAAIGEEEVTAVDVTRPAAAVYLEVTSNTDDEEEEEVAFEDLSNVLDLVEQTLAGAGYSFPLRTSTALLAVRLSTEAEDAGRVTLARQVEALRETLEQREGAHPAVRYTLSSKLGEVLCRNTGDKLAMVGGPLLELEQFSQPSQ